MELIWAVTGEVGFSTSDHLLLRREERRDGQKIWDDTNKANPKELVEDFKASDLRLILRAKKKGSWLNACDTTVNGTVLAAAEFCGFYVQVMTSPPPNFKKINVRSLYFSVRHGIICMKG